MHDVRQLLRTYPGLATLRPLHAVALALVALTIPLLGRVGLAPFPDWSMYSRSGTYRIEILAENAVGEHRYVAASALASRSAYDVKNALSGAEHFRTGPSIDVMAAALPELARLACRVTGARSIRLSFWSRRAPTGPTEQRDVSRRCEVE